MQHQRGWLIYVNIHFRCSRSLGWRWSQYFHTVNGWLFYWSWGLLCLCQYVHIDSLQGHSWADCSPIKLKSRPNHSHQLTTCFFPPLGLRAAAFDLEKVSLIKLEWSEICQHLLDWEQARLFSTKPAACLNTGHFFLIFIQENVLQSMPDFVFGFFFSSALLQIYIVTCTGGFPQWPLCPTGLLANLQEQLEVKCFA